MTFEPGATRHTEIEKVLDWGKKMPATEVCETEEETYRVSPEVRPSIEVEFEKGSRKDESAGKDFSTCGWSAHSDVGAVR